MGQTNYRYMVEGWFPDKNNPVSRKETRVYDGKEITEAYEKALADGMKEIISVDSDEDISFKTSGIRMARGRETIDI